RPPLDELDDLLGGYTLSVDDDALPKVDEMRRRVGPDAQPLRAQQRFRCRNAAPLPVRSSDVNRRKRAMWIAERAEDRNRSLETKFERSGRAGVQILERLIVARVCLARRPRYRCRRGRQGEVHPVAAGRPDM